MIKVSALGRLVADPTTNNVNGRAVCNFRIAVRTRHKNEAGEAISDFYNVSAWGALSENCAKYLRKGSQIMVAGSLKQRAYVTKEGAKGVSLEINADEVGFAGGNSAVQNNGSAQAQSQNTTYAPSDDNYVEEDLPF